ncbi:NrsF family protein [Roseixanthobacter pseudopolyaromaticivorans]|uniref:NrsF family protein n=1 Tax=Xanthobacteraceae TaxID=335928 RepID=UPI003729B2E1
MKTEDLIGVLAQDAPVAWRLSSRLALAFSLGALIATTLFALAVGVRPDLLAVGGSARFLFKFLFALALLLGAAGAVTRIGRPGVEIGPWAFLLVALPIALAFAVMVEMVVTPEALWATRLVGRNAAFCLTVIPILALAPLACLIVALRDSAPSRPGLAGAVAGLAASGIAATLYASHCPDDSPLFVAVWYSSAIAMVVAAGYLMGARFLRW